jgi:hypothetical protein
MKTTVMTTSNFVFGSSSSFFMAGSDRTTEVALSPMPNMSLRGNMGTASSLLIMSLHGGKGAINLSSRNRNQCHTWIFYQTACPLHCSI